MVFGVVRLRAQPKRMRFSPRGLHATFAFDGLPLLVGGGAGVHGHEEEGPALPGPRPLPLLCLVVVLLVCSSVFLAHPLDYNCGTKNRRSQLWAVTKLDLAGYSQIIPGRRQKRPKIRS